MADNNQHSGHRKRLRNRAIADPDLNTFCDHEIIEMLLFFSIPRMDTNTIAHSLVRKFKGLRGVFEASREEIASVEGVGENSAFLLSLIPAITRRYLRSRSVNNVYLTSAEHLGEALMPYFIGKKEENVYALFLDEKRKSIVCEFISEGDPSAVSFNQERLIRLAKQYRARYVVIAHNHPGGFANPSDQDFVTTQSIYYRLEEIGVTLLDHLIISDPLEGNGDIGEYVSLAESYAFLREENGKKKV